MLFFVPLWMGLEYLLSFRVLPNEAARTFTSGFIALITVVYSMMLFEMDRK